MTYTALFEGRADTMLVCREPGPKQSFLIAAKAGGESRGRGLSSLLSTAGGDMFIKFPRALCATV